MQDQVNLKIMSKTKNILGLHIKMALGRVMAQHECTTHQEKIMAYTQEWWVVGWVGPFCFEKARHGTTRYKHLKFSEIRFRNKSPTREQMNLDGV